MRLRSADPSAPPAISLNWLADPAEMAAMVAACRFARELAATGPLGAAATRNLDPGPGVASDEQLEAWIRAECQHTYHPACTCRMGAEGDGVLDPELRVRGVDGLRVVDASSLPSITSGNTHAPVVMVAERAADLMLGRPLLPAEDPAAATPATVSASDRPLTVGGAQGLGDLGHGIDLGDGEAVGQVLAHRLQKRGSNRLQLDPAGRGQPHQREPAVVHGGRALEQPPPHEVLGHA